MVRRQYHSQSLAPPRSAATYYLNNAYHAAKLGYQAHQYMSKKYPKNTKVTNPKGKRLRGGGKKPKPNAPVKKAIRNLQHSVGLHESIHTRRQISSGNITTNDNEANYLLLQANRSSDLESAMTLFRYFNPATAGTLTTADPTSGTYSREIQVDNVSVHINLRNNYQVPVRCRVYTVTPKDDTSVTPTSAFTQGMTDQYITSPGLTSLTSYPSDIKQFNELWKIVDTTNYLIQPGSEKELKYNTGRFDYNSSVQDSHALSFQKQWKAVCFMVRIEGVLAHDSAGTLVGLSDAGLDWIMRRTWTFRYDAGIKLHDFSEDVDVDDITVPLVSNKPLADNQSYSIA